MQLTRLASYALLIVEPRQRTLAGHQISSQHPSDSVLAMCKNDFR